ncbi:MAG: zinc-binding dehydrogenase [Actinomycetota bacterium]|nr:zinc-binding dehydrogenase [Actinomycetota bacterium]
MRAAVMTRHGGPEALEVSEVADPVPGPGQVRIAVRAAEVNNTDPWTREGAYGADPGVAVGWRQVPIEVPRIQGADVCGVVESVGDGVDTLLLGRRVLVDPARYDGPEPDAQPDDILGSERDGGFAELVVVDATDVHDVTDSPLDDAELASLPIAHGTAMGMLARAGATAGERLVATGASGGVGLAVVQLAAALGLEVVAVSTADKDELLRAQGAAAVVDRRSDTLADDVRRAAGGPVEVVADVVGGEQFSVWPGVLARRGRIVVAGAVAGPIVSLDLRPLYLEQRRIIGSTMHTRDDFARLVDLARTGAVRPVVAHRFPLGEIHAAQQALRAPDTVGKVVIEIG